MKDLQVITLPNGESAVVFTENPSKQLGIVDIATIKKLAQMLPSVNLYEIKSDFKARISGAENIKEYVAIIAEEFNFHITVNLLQHYQIVNDKVKNEEAVVV